MQICFLYFYHYILKGQNRIFSHAVDACLAVELPIQLD